LALAFTYLSKTAAKAFSVTMGSRRENAAR
jgi:hypothetical protein